MIFDFVRPFFLFLGKPEGELFKKSIELVLFSIVTYMILSEYTRDQKVELKYLLLAFLGLTIEKFLMTFLYLKVIFGTLAPGTLVWWVPVVENTLQLVALILLTNAFIYPVFAHRTHRLKRYIRLQITLALIAALGIEILWYYALLSRQYIQFSAFVGDTVFVLLKIAILAYPLIVLWRASKLVEIQYKLNIMAAFAIYLIQPLIHLANNLFFSGVSARLRVAEHPFPFIAVALFTQVIYLKLVDKALLKSRLEISEKKYKEEKEISQLKDTFISTVSHELKTPLTSIILYISLLLDGTLGKIEQKQADALGVVKSEAKRLTNLINDILSLSKLEAKAETLSLGRFNLRDIDSPIYNTLAKEKKIAIVNTIPDNFEVRVDPDKFRQIYVNLLSNAIKFTNDGGTITIGAKDLAGSWQFSVADTGPGISQQDISLIFNKFYQIEDHMTRSKEGTGLGLAITKEIVELHGGSIEVDSKLGIGTTFILTFPKEIKS